MFPLMCRTLAEWPVVHQLRQEEGREPQRTLPARAEFPEVVREGELRDGRADDRAGSS